MTPNQLALLISIYTSGDLIVGTYLSDRTFLQGEGLILERSHGVWDTTTKGEIYIKTACKLRVTPTQVYEVTLP